MELQDMIFKNISLSKSLLGDFYFFSFFLTNCVCWHVTSNVLIPT